MPAERVAPNRPGSGPAAAVPPGTRVYAVGDSHGCTQLLGELHAAILEDSAAADARAPAPAERRVMVYLGDYIDRGPDSRGLLEMLVAAPLPGFETVHLMGNHDLLMRQFLDGEDVSAMWMMNGGVETLRSYGVDLGALYSMSGGVGRLRADLEARLPAAHREFLSGLRLSHVEGGYFFAHAGVRPGVPLEDQDTHDLVWIREPFLSSVADHGKVVVHGHSRARAPEVRANRIGIDTGACYGGRLTALALEGDGHRFLQA
jgi:serine/threonine protein phosphatase 1